MRLIGGREFGPDRTDVMISKSGQHKFSAKDVICVPADFHAIFCRDGSFSDSIREGRTSLTEAGIGKCTGDLYFVRLAPEEPLRWGKGSVHVGDKVYGMNGTLTVKVISSGRFLSTYISENMPFTGEQLYESIQEQAVQSLADALSDSASTSSGEDLKGQVARLAGERMEEYLRKRGLCVEQIIIRDIIVRDA